MVLSGLVVVMVLRCFKWFDEKATLQFCVFQGSSWVFIRVRNEHQVD